MPNVGESCTEFFLVVCVERGTQRRFTFVYGLKFMVCSQSLAKLNTEMHRVY